MSIRKYLEFNTTKVSIVVKAKDRQFFPHTVNAYAGGLFLGSVPGGLSDSTDTSQPLLVPEETDITINVMANDGRTPVIVDVRGAKQKDNYIRQDILDVTVNFKSRVGVALVDVECGGSRFTFVMDVCPRKIEYDHEYYSLIDDLQSMSRALAFDWLRSSSFAGNRGSEAGASDIEFLSALDSEISHLTACFHTINQSPSRIIQHQLQTTRLDRITHVNLSVVKALRQGRGSGPMMELTDIGIHAHEKIPSYRAVVSYDTPANRWLKQQLITVKGHIARILRADGGSNAESMYGDGVGDRLRSLYTELTAIQSQPFLQDVKPVKGRNEAPMEVLSRVGYKMAAGIFDTLERMFIISDGVQLVNSRLISELYEEWCYLKVATLVGELTKGAIDPRDTIEISNGKLRMRFKKNKASRINIESDGNDAYHVAYNMEYHTITGVQKPDIIIEVNRGQRPSTILVLDAKYRLVDKDTYGNSIKPQPPVDAINALHRYRDAIYLTEGARKVRPVVKGVILYPPAIDTDINNLPYWKSIAQVGIGAIPLLPNRDEYLRNFLATVFDPKYADFYKPGPSFEPYESLLRREKAQ